MDFGISVEDEEEMNPVYVKMRSKEPGSSGKSIYFDYINYLHLFVSYISKFLLPYIRIFLIFGL